MVVASYHQLLYYPYIGSTAQTPTTPKHRPLKTITGLTGGTTYPFKVAAINPAGPGQDRTVKRHHPTTPTAPGVPTGVSVSAGGLQATVSWMTPGSDAEPDHEYAAIPYTGFTAHMLTMVAAPATFMMITEWPRQTTSFKFAAVNAIGPGPESTALNRSPDEPRRRPARHHDKKSSSTSISSPAFYRRPERALLGFITSDGPLPGTETFSMSPGWSDLAAPSPYEYQAGTAEIGRPTPRRRSQTRPSPPPARAAPTSDPSLWRPSAARIRSSMAPGGGQRRLRRPVGLADHEPCRVLGLGVGNDWDNGDRTHRGFEPDQGRRVPGLGRRHLLGAAPDLDHPHQRDPGDAQRHCPDR